MRITNVRTICTAPEGIALVVVKVETSSPGLYRTRLRHVYAATI